MFTPDSIPLLGSKNILNSVVSDELVVSSTVEHCDLYRFT